MRGRALDSFILGRECRSERKGEEEQEIMQWNFLDASTLQTFYSTALEREQPTNVEERTSDYYYNNNNH